VSSFDQELDRRLNTLREKGLGRSLRRIESPQGVRIRINGRELVNFSSNDYLGLANHPALKEAAFRAVADHGVGAGASRLICGSLAPCHGLEEALAAFKHTAAALTFSTGYATALGTIPALVGKGDVVVLDKLAHACLVDAARLSGARLRVFAHNDLDALEDILKWADRGARSGGQAPSSELRPRVLIVTESVFSMDGDLAPLREIAELKERHGAWLFVDEAHATGVWGADRRGWVDECGLTDRVEVQMGTLGKALGASGGYIAGSRPLIDYLVNRARSLIFSTAPAPAAVAAAHAAVALVQSDEGRRRCDRLWERVGECRTTLSHCRRTVAEGRDVRRLTPATRDQPVSSSPIVPLILGEEAEAVRVAAALMDRGILLPAIRYPAVARGSARLRLTLSAEHTPEDLARLGQALASVVPR
jgi:8-amino-7-oxononanoate synthase